MNPVRKRRLILWLFIITVTTVVTLLITYALRQNINLFFTPTQISQGAAPVNRLIRLGGMVVKGSVFRSTHDLKVQFKLTDFSNEIVVDYQGILPDLFREGQGIVATGEMIDKMHFKAHAVLAKHDANYMPPDLKNALTVAKKQ